MINVWIFFALTLIYTILKSQKASTPEEIVQ